MTTRLGDGSREQAALDVAAVDGAGERGLALLADGDAEQGIAVVRTMAERMVADHGAESEVAGIALAKLADVQRQAGAPDADRLATLTDAIKAFSASVGPTDPRTTSAFAQLAHAALNAQAVEVAVTAGMQALGGLQRRGEGESAEAGEVYATLAMAAAARQSPAAMGAAERAHALTAGLPANATARKRARTAWSALGSPRRLPVTGELAIVAFGAPPSLVVEHARTAPDGAADQHNHGMRSEAARAFRDAIATAPFAWRASAGGFEVASRTGGGATLRFLASTDDREDVELVLDAAGLAALRAAVADAIGGVVAPDVPGRNDPCPCGSGKKYKRCCGR